jgi:membrane protein
LPPTGCAPTPCGFSEALETWSLRFLTPQTVEEVIMPTLTETLSAGRADILSISFLVSVWWGSRALQIFLRTIAIMYGQGGERGAVRTRLLSLTAYLASLVVMGLTLPLLLIGPGSLQRWLPERLDVLALVSWPVVGLLAIVGLGALYHVATPHRSPLVRDLPGAVLAVVLWVVSSALIRVWADTSVGRSTVFGPLTAPIILMIWLYFISLAVLLGAALNAAVRRLWPRPEYRGPRVRAAQWWKGRRGHDQPGERPEGRGDTRAAPDLDSAETVG